MSELTRRDFLKGAGVSALGVAGVASVAGTASLVACSPSETTSGGGSGSTGGGGAGGGGGLSASTTSAVWRTPPASIADSEVATEDSCDILILGLGNAGAAAGRAAAEAGAKVYIFHDTTEDALMFRGGGEIANINSRFHARFGVPKVDLVEFVNDWQVRSNNRSDPGLIMNFARHSGDVFDWFYGDLITEDDFNDPDVNAHVTWWQKGWDETHRHKTNYGGVKSFIGTANLKSSLKSSGEGIQMTAGKKAISVVQEKGGKVFWSTPAVQLTTDSSGAVTGAIGEGLDGYVKVTASKGVIICTGGFGTNKEMCEDLLWEIMWNKAEDDSPSAMMDSDGKGIAMGYWVGGRIDPCMATMDGAYWYPCDKPADPLGATAGLWINADGKRYCNEGFGSTELMAMPGARQPVGNIYSVFGSNVDELLQVQPFGHMTLDYVNGGADGLAATMEAALAAGAAGVESSMDMGGGGEGGAGAEGGGAPAGVEGAEGAGGGEGGDGGEMAGMMAAMQGATVYAANDLKTLAGYLGLTGDAAANFVESVEHYNELCASGVDSDFGKDPALLIPLEAPYFAYGGQKVLGSMMLTTSGLQIDENGAVLGADWRPIEGLFAAGNAGGSRWGWQYFTSIAGESLGTVSTLGAMTGKHVATGTPIKDLTI
jgi:succinate dehydrogenase/fumarate reductase flavoprotein subunit